MQQAPVDLVIDHSVQVDVAKSENVVQANMELEFQGIKERLGFLKLGSTNFQDMLVVPPGSGIVHQVNLGEVEPCISGPKRPHYRVPLKDMKSDWHSSLDNKVGFKDQAATVKSVFPRRLVGCRGGEGEDEHHAVWFWLDKNKAKCPVCSHYFTLDVDVSVGEELPSGGKLHTRRIRSVLDHYITQAEKPQSDGTFHERRRRHSWRLGTAELAVTVQGRPLQEARDAVTAFVVAVERFLVDYALHISVHERYEIEKSLSATMIVSVSSESTVEDITAAKNAVYQMCLGLGVQ